MTRALRRAHARALAVAATLLLAACSHVNPVDVVLISHNHYDDLDVDSVRALNRQMGGAPLFVVPLGLERWFQDIGITNVHALDWWDHTETAGATVYLTPVQHWRRRTLTDTNQSSWGGFVIEARSGGAKRRLFFTGEYGVRDEEFIVPRHGATKVLG